MPKKAKGKAKGGSRPQPQSTYVDIEALPFVNEDDLDEEDIEYWEEQQADTRGRKLQKDIWDRHPHASKSKNSAGAGAWSTNDNWAGEWAEDSHAKNPDPWATAHTGADRAAGETWGTDTGWGDGAHGAQGGWGATAETGWGGSGGTSWGHHEQKNTGKVAWGDSAWPEYDNNKRKSKGGKKEKKQSKGEWGPNFDHQMQAYHEELTRRMEKYAPPPRGAEFDPLPSRTLSMARSDTDVARTFPGAPGNGGTFITFIDSGGAALKSAEMAFFNRYRPAQDRFHWMFSPSKDERVSHLLNWIQGTSYGLASLGVSRFLETGERGALLTNVEYRSKKSPREPAFDWLTWTQANSTLDRTLQQSLAYYDPEEHVLVFVFLLSKSGNSVAIWRRKVSIPITLRVTHGEAIRKKKEEIAKRNTFIVVDDYKPPPPPPPEKKKKAPEEAQAPKKKWFRWAA